MISAGQRRFLTMATAWAVVGSLAMLPASPAWASYTLDRWYQMGDDSEEPGEPGTEAGTGAPFGFVLDSIGASMQDNFQDLSPVGGPLYVDISGDRPVPANSLDNRAISFDGTTQYLHGHFLNIPEEADASTGQVENYTGITDRGYQLWVKPDQASTGAQQNFLDDADTHRALISADGNFAFEIRTSVQFGSMAAEAGQWTHIAQVRPDGDFGGSFGWVNGRAVAKQTGNYGSSMLDLAIAADVEDEAGLGQSEFTPSFSGMVSDAEMFVLGGGFGTFDYTTDNGYFTDVFLPGTAGYGYTDADNNGHNDEVWVKGDINFDGALNRADLDAFVAGWLSTNADTVVGGGPGIGDFVTLGLGDVDLDGDTDVDDWVALRATGISAGVAAFSQPLNMAVPEPSTLLLFLSLLGYVALRFRSPVVK